MAPNFSLRPKTAKGALLAIGFDAALPAINSNRPVFVFQYNPDKLTRTFSFLNNEGTPTNNEKTQLNQGPPTELIHLTLELDAADQLEQPEKNQTTITNGLHPQLAALESIMYPPRGISGPTELPVALFFWGPKRTMPVCLVSMQISEENFDANLNPIRANINLCMRVLKLSELKKGSLGYTICGNNLNLKETLALLYRQQSLGSTHFEQVSSGTSGNVGAKKASATKSKPKK